MSLKSTPASADLIRKEKTFGARNYAPVPVVVERAKDCLVWDVEGREYIDMMGAYSAVSHGHLHPRIVAALQEQLGKVAVTSRAYHGTTLGPFLEKLCGLAEEGIVKCCFAGEVLVEGLDAQTHPPCHLVQAQAGHALLAHDVDRDLPDGVEHSLAALAAAFTGAGHANLLCHRLS